MDKTLKLGMVGAGFVAHFHARAIKQVRSINLSGVFSPVKANSESLSNFAQTNGIGECKIYNSIDEMAQNVDAIAIFSPNFARVETMEKIARAVKNGANVTGVICEKPLGRNMEEAGKMVQLAKEVNLLTAYFENQIHMKNIQSQLEQLQPQVKTMGPLSITRCSEEHGGPHSGWFWDPTLQGGGVLSDMGCHSIAVGWYALTPYDKPIDFLKPVSINAETSLLKWGLPQWYKKINSDFNITFDKKPAEDFATGMVTFENPETGQISKAQFTNSWMFEKQGLRLFMDGMGPGYAFEVNTLLSSLNLFIGDVAAESVSDSEVALEKSTASRGLLAVQSNEADLYGYTDENEDAVKAFLGSKDGMLNWEYGLEITKLVMAAYMSAELKRTIDLTDPQVLEELETFVPLIQQGRGREVLKVL